MAHTMRVWCVTSYLTGFGRALATLVLVAGLILGAPMLMQAQAPRSPTPKPVNGVVQVQSIARGLEHPWALAFLPDGRLLVTERPGRARIIEPDGRLSEPLAGVPRVLARGQGGLLNVALNPRFAENRLVYLSCAEPGEGGTAGTAVARGRLGDGRLADVRVIYRQQTIGEGTAKPGMEQPVYYQDLVIAPSRMTFYTGEAFPTWQGSLLIGSLRPGGLVRLTLEDGRVTGEERYLDDLGARIRDLRQRPDGLLYLLTDSRDGGLLWVMPAAPR